MTLPANLPAPCVLCGGLTLMPATQRSVLLAVCDVLVCKALEKLGSFVVRAERARYNLLGARPMLLAHTLWPPTDAMVTKALRAAWDVVPALLDRHGCCDVTSHEVTGMLDSYVHDLAVTGTAHDLNELAHRFHDQLGLPVFDHVHAPELASR